MNTTPKCSKCGGEMQEGFVPDEDFSKRWVSRWVAGKPEQGLLGHPKVSGKQHYSILSFRCSKCGYLEFYAPGT
jgi:predicted nucleic-acid-binding Zn-ribbon protein